ncbi:hypothetical protein TURU_012297 [Turdus rufiventris]|nr:hypothetical protein TURU_012297 [Turdus rufiventris]
MKSSDLEFDTDIPAPARAVRTSSSHKACTTKDTGKPFKTACQGEWVVPCLIHQELLNDPAEHNAGTSWQMKNEDSSKEDEAS